MKPLGTRFNTPHGVVTVNSTELDTDCDGNPVIIYNCLILTMNGSRFHSEPLPVWTLFDRDRAEQIAYRVTPKGKKAVRQRVQAIQNFLKQCKNF